MEGAVRVLACVHMQARLVKYTEFFVGFNMTLNEAAALVAIMDVAKEHVPAELRAVADEFQREIEQRLARATELQEKE